MELRICIDVDDMDRAIAFYTNGLGLHVGRRFKSDFVEILGAGSPIDLLLNAAVIAALVFDQIAGVAGADPLFGLAIAGWLGWGAWRASQSAVEQLMDHEWPHEKKERFLAVLARNPDITGVHDLRTRTSGNRDFVQFHVWVDPEMTVRQAHGVMDTIEARLMAEFPDTEILIHPDPEGLVDENGPAAEDVLPRTCDVEEYRAAHPDIGKP